jgi:hypothetical protein
VLLALIGFGSDAAFNALTGLTDASSYTFFMGCAILMLYRHSTISNMVLGLTERLVECILSFYDIHLSTATTSCICSYTPKFLRYRLGPGLSVVIIALSTAKTIDTWDRYSVVDDLMCR